MSYQYPIAFQEDKTSQITGTLTLDEPLSYPLNAQESGFYRPAHIRLNDGGELEIVLYHNPATAAFIYLRTVPADARLLELLGLSNAEIVSISTMTLPGQLCMGSARSHLIERATRMIFAAPVLRPTIAERCQHNLAIFPIAREGLKYQISEAIFDNYGYYCDEVLLDAHHVFDSSVPVYKRKVELGIFKDKDLDRQQHENITAAFIADSIASGLVMKEVIAKIKERFSRIEQIEVIAPLATIRGLCRIAQAECSRDIRVRVHVFETLLNALPPDYYYSAHYNIPEMHIRPDLETAYRRWWGRDSAGSEIADTACAGYGWSEVFYSPRKQVEMINSELMQRHNLTITDILRRNLKSGVLQENHAMVCR
ncbi:MAG: hypothetical protein WHV66_10840 [Anaerolineales bacterium]|jgi:hypothetical protein